MMGRGTGERAADRPLDGPSARLGRRIDLRRWDARPTGTDWGSSLAAADARPTGVVAAPCQRPDGLDRAGPAKEVALAEADA